MTKNKIIVKRFVMLLTQDICGQIWQAYERDFVTIVNEFDFLDIMFDLADDCNVAAFGSIEFIYPEGGIFDKYLDELKKESFVIEHYK